MSAFQLANAGLAQSAFETRAAALSYEVSRVLSRRNFSAPGNAIDVILDLISGSGLSRAAAIWSERKGEGQEDNAFGLVDDPSEYTVGVYEDSYILLYLGLVAQDAAPNDPLRLLAELLAQQLGRFMAAERLRQDNDCSHRQLFLDREALQLRKTMERARALLARFGSMTPIEATDYLVSVSVRTGRPLLAVAERIVLAYGGPDAGFRWPPEKDAFPAYSIRV